MSRAWLANLALLSWRPSRRRLIREFDASQWLTAAELRQWQALRLQRVLAVAAQQVPFYRERAPDLLADASAGPHAALATLPLVDKATILPRRADFLAAGVADSRRIARNTGGSSGTLFSFYLDLTARERRVAVDMRGRSWAGWCLGERQAQLWAHAGDLRLRESLSSRLRNTLVNQTLTIDCTDLRADQLARHLAELRSFRPRVLIGYSSALAYFAEAAGPGQTLPGLTGVISSAETLRAEQRAAITAAWGVPVLNRYGSREFGVVAQQCERQAGLHLSEESLVWEIVDPAGQPVRPGERGELVLTDLDNLVMPFLRYRTGDLAIAAAAPCPCGRGLAVLAAIEGRVSDLLVGRNGRVIACPGPVFFLAGTPGVRQLQIRQDRRDAVELVLVPADGWGEASQARLTARMRELLGDVEVVFTEVPAIAPSPSGKYRFSISTVSPFQGPPTQPPA